MPQVKTKIESAWYVNQAKDVDGKPRPLTLGTITFAPEQKRFIEARVLLESRHNHERFMTALGNGNLVCQTKQPPRFEEPEVVEPEPEPEVVEPEVVEPEPEPEPEVYEVEETEESPAKKAIKRRGSSKKRG